MTDSVVDGYRVAVTPDRLIGRVESVRSTIALPIVLLGPLLAGFLLSTVSLRATGAVFTACGIVLALWGTLSPRSGRRRASQSSTTSFRPADGRRTLGAMVSGYVLVEGMRPDACLEGLPLTLTKIERYAVANAGTSTSSAEPAGRRHPSVDGQARLGSPLRRQGAALDGHAQPLPRRRDGRTAARTRTGHRLR